MNTLTRWLRFNTVGVIGMGVQLTTLSLLNRTWPHHSLVASTAAVECAILHNFNWHRRWTWRDQGLNQGHGHHAQPFTQLVRFHLSNGLVSLLGNLALMRLLLRSARLPVLLANFIAILCCSTLNFVLSHTWAFRGAQKYKPPIAA